MRTSRTVKYPHVVRLPKGSLSPTNSMYKRYDIVAQGAVLHSYLDTPLTLRSTQPFTLRISVNGIISEVSSQHITPR